MKILMCSNFDEDYFEESFINLPSGLSDFTVAAIRKMIIDELAADSNPVFWRCVEDNYELQGGME